ncbi:hypothetical protein AU378_07750 [Chryseobacterium kwangjuense]|uniref:Uncharacterized protein n=1 Tax=Chryseobacterium kwangjuense TaxID=267125 RepID=A0A135WL71_9FLAO|nr:hypothetical protein AU378_07750 [Chryseobacterium kwangjuense]
MISIRISFKKDEAALPRDAYFIIIIRVFRICYFILSHHYFSRQKVHYFIFTLLLFTFEYSNLPE